MDLNGLLDGLRMILDGAALAGGTTVVVWALTLFYRKVFGKDKPSEVVLKALAFLVAVIVAYVQVMPALPELGADPVGFALALLAAATTVFKAAQILYDKIWQAVLKRINPALV